MKFDFNKEGFVWFRYRNLIVASFDLFGLRLVSCHHVFTAKGEVLSKVTALV